jgi:hypothetical protein
LAGPKYGPKRREVVYFILSAHVVTLFQFILYWQVNRPPSGVAFMADKLVPILMRWRALPARLNRRGAIP